jgi:hypothetical protein
MGKWFVECFLVFVGYTTIYTFTLGFIYPMQKIIMPENSLLASLLFLPHGVRATAFFLWIKSSFLFDTGAFCDVVHFCAWC